jgi:hypothetical protein
MDEKFNIKCTMDNVSFVVKLTTYFLRGGLGNKFVRPWAYLSNSLHWFFFSTIHNDPACWNEEIGERRKGRKVMKNKGKKTLN